MKTYRTVSFMSIMILFSCTGTGWKTAKTTCPCVEGWHCVEGICVKNNSPDALTDTAVADTFKDKDPGTYQGKDIEKTEGLVQKDEFVDTGETVCVPKTCKQLEWECGQPDDGCGANLDCGHCSDGKACVKGKCLYCGNGNCEKDKGENCNTCADDCGCKEGLACNNGICLPKDCSPACNNQEFCFEGKCYHIARPVTPTNQTICRNNDTQIQCPGKAGSDDCGNIDFCGQDAQYYENKRTFKKRAIGGNPVIEDDLTGLMWMPSVTDKELSPGEADQYCRTSNYAGFTDWRLPEVDELSDLIDYTQWGPAMDPNLFQNLPNACYAWTATDRAADRSNTWSVFIGTGNVFPKSMNDTAIGICVRGYRSANSSGFLQREYVPGEGIVMDMDTGLMWQKAYVEGKNWKQALSYCESLKYGGFSDWRLPTIKELKTLIDYVKHDPASSFPDMPAAPFWTSSINVQQPESLKKSWNVEFKEGIIFDRDKTSAKDVRCVRMGNRKPK